MKIFLILLINTIFYYCNGQNRLIFVKEYKTIEETLSRGIVLEFTEDSVRSYTHPVGYIWWTIEKKEDVKNNDYFNTIEFGKYHLSYKKHSSYLLINNNIIIHLIFLNGSPPIVFIIEMKRKKLYK